MRAQMAPTNSSRRNGVVFIVVTGRRKWGGRTGTPQKVTAWLGLRKHIRLRAISEVEESRRRRGEKPARRKDQSINFCALRLLLDCSTAPKIDLNFSPRGASNAPSMTVARASFFALGLIV